MKRFTIVIAIFVVGIGLLGASSVQAQNSDNASPTVQTSVIQDISITSNQDVQFGEVFQNSNPELDPTTSGGNTDVGSGAQVGKLTITGGSDVSITVDLNTASLGLTNGDSDLSEDPTYTPWLVGSINDSFSDQTTIFDQNGSDQNPSISINGDGNYFLYLGGNLGTISTDASGTYSNTITVTASYN